MLFVFFPFSAARLGTLPFGRPARRGIARLHSKDDELTMLPRLRWWMIALLLASGAFALLESCDPNESPPQDSAAFAPPIRLSEWAAEASYISALKPPQDSPDWPIARAFRTDGTRALYSPAWTLLDQEIAEENRTASALDEVIASGHAWAWLVESPSGSRVRIEVEYSIEPRARPPVSSAPDDAAEPEHPPTPPGWLLFPLEQVPLLDGASLPLALRRGGAASEPIRTEPTDAGAGRWTVRIDVPAHTPAMAVIWNGSGIEPGIRIHDVDLTTAPLWQHLGHELSTEPVPERVAVLGERRHAFRPPPGSVLRWRTRLPSASVELQTAVALQSEAHSDWGQVPLRFTVGVRDAENSADPPFAPRASLEIRPGEFAAHHGWQDVVISLAEWAGREVELEFRCSPIAAPETAPTELFAIADPTLVEIETPARRPPSVLLISIDTLRPDRLGFYGCEVPTSPNLDAFAARSLVFHQARSHSTYTLPSHASLLSGQHPLHHGVNRHPTTRAGPHTTFLAELLRERGYLTAAFTGGGFLSASFGFDRGFDQYSEHDVLTGPVDRRLEYLPRDGDRAFNEQWREHDDLDRVLDFVRRNRERPFFLFLHSFLVHGYMPTAEALDAVDPGRQRAGELTASPPGEFNVFQRDERSRDPGHVESLLALYDATIWMMDAEIGRLIAELESMELLDDLILVLTSDHGEEFGEHGGLGHGRTLYEETVRVPMLVHHPNVAAAERWDPTWLTDVVPTILELTDTRAPSTEVHGSSLLRSAEQRRTESTAVLENRCQLPWERYALLDGESKLVWNAGPHREDPSHPEYELTAVDLQTGEERTLDYDETKHGKLRDRLRSTVREWWSRAAEHRADEHAIDATLAEHLRRLGYAVDEN